MTNDLWLKKSLVIFLGFLKMIELLVILFIIKLILIFILIKKIVFPQEIL